MSRKKSISMPIDELRKNPLNYHFNNDGTWRFTSDKEKWQLLEKQYLECKNALEEISQYTGEDDQNRIRSTSEAEIAKETLDKVSKMII